MLDAVWKWNGFLVIWRFVLITVFFLIYCWLSMLHYIKSNTTCALIIVKIHIYCKIMCNGQWQFCIAIDISCFSVIWCSWWDTLLSTKRKWHSYFWESWHCRCNYTFIEVVLVIKRMFCLWVWSFAKLMSVNICYIWLWM